MMSGLADIRLQRVRIVAADCMNQIIGEFRAGAKITVIVRTPGNADADFLMTNDELAEVGAVVAKLQASGAHP